MMEVQQIDTDRDVKNIQVLLCLSALKHRYAKVMTELYYNFLFARDKEIIKSEWKAAGITDNLTIASKNNKKTIKDNPFQYSFLSILDRKIKYA